MHFDDGKATRTNCIMECNGCVRVGGGIEDDTDEAFIGGTTDVRNELAFVVRLHERDVDVFTGCDSANGIFDISERRRAVDGCFAFSEPVEVGTGNDKNVSTG